MKPGNEDRPSPLTKAHQTLYELQEEKGSYLTYDEVIRKLRGTSGIVFSPGTTFDDILEKLEKYDLIAGDKLEGRIFVKSFSSGPVVRNWDYRRYEAKEEKKALRDKERSPNHRPIKYNLLKFPTSSLGGTS